MSRTLSLYDAGRRWVDTGTIPSGIRPLAFLRDTLARVPADARPAFYRVGSSGELKPCPDLPPKEPTHD